MGNNKNEMFHKENHSFPLQKTFDYVDLFSKIIFFFLPGKLELIVMWLISHIRHSQVVYSYFYSQ